MVGSNLSGQSIPELESQLRSTSNSIERTHISFELAEKYLGIDYRKSAQFAKQAYDLAAQAGDKDMLIRGSFLLGDVYQKLKDNGEAIKYLEACSTHASAAGQTKIAISCMDQLISMARKSSNYRKAFEYSQRAFDFLEKSKPVPNANTTRPPNTLILTQNKAEVDRLQKQQESILEEIATLNREKTNLLADKGVLEFIQAEMDVDKTAYDSLAQEKERVERTSKYRQKQLSKLLQAKLDDSVSLSRIISTQNEALDKAELQIARDNYLRYLLIALSILVIAITMLFYNRFKSRKRAHKALEFHNELIEEERRRSDQLLLNILPGPIAEELKKNGKAKAQKYQNATVLFTDFKNFSRIAAKMNPEDLVNELDKCFKAFDYIISQYKIEKIKTIGDAYMCACGIADKNASPSEMIQAALDIQEYLTDIRKDRLQKGLPYFEARIGIHTGPVVAGVVGINKFVYDIWGETVNIANQVEQRGLIGKVSISESTYQYVHDKFECKSRGSILLKNRESIQTFTVEEIK